MSEAPDPLAARVDALEQAADLQARIARLEAAQSGRWVWLLAGIAVGLVGGVFVGMTTGTDAPPPPAPISAGAPAPPPVPTTPPSRSAAPPTQLQAADDAALWRQDLWAGAKEDWSAADRTTYGARFDSVVPTQRVRVLQRLLLGADQRCTEARYTLDGLPLQPRRREALVHGPLVVVDLLTVAGPHTLHVEFTCQAGKESVLVRATREFVAPADVGVVLTADRGPAGEAFRARIVPKR